MRPQGPFPVLVLLGEHGTAKTTLMTVLRSLVDPHSSPKRPLPKSVRDLFISACSSGMLAFDNVSVISPEMSDALCQISTGGGYATRTLYSDKDETILEAKRPLILNGIDEVVTRPDLADRALFLTLAPIPEDQRKTEAEFWTDFEVARPKILGAMFDALAEGLKRQPSIRLPEMPRMADFAKWAAACETAFWPAGSVLTAYKLNRAEVVETVLDGDTVASAVRAHFDVQPEPKAWSGTASELLVALNEVVPDQSKREKNWPTNARALSSRLRRVAPLLRKIHIDIEFVKEGKARSRMIYIASTALSTSVVGIENIAPAASAPSARPNEPNVVNGLNIGDWRTQNALVDAMADPSDTNAEAAIPNARSNSLKSLVADEADAADANFPTISEQAETSASGWRGRI